MSKRHQLQEVDLFLESTQRIWMNLCTWQTHDCEVNLSLWQHPIQKSEPSSCINPGMKSEPNVMMNSPFGSGSSLRQTLSLRMNQYGYQPLICSEPIRITSPSVDSEPSDYASISWKRIRNNNPLFGEWTYMSEQPIYIKWTLSIKITLGVKVNLRIGWFLFPLSESFSTNNPNQ